MVSGSGFGQAGTTGTISGFVVDPAGARIPNAAVHVTRSDGAVQDILTDAEGHFTVSLPPATYDLEVSAFGFDRAALKGVTLEPNAHLEERLKLKIQSLDEQVNVPSDDSLSTSGTGNKSALVFEGEQLAGLSDDDAVLQKQVLAMAGSGIRPPQVYIDGFTGGKFPPKDSIRQIRINENPFTTQYDQFGFGRVEVFTKPGTGNLHGQFSVNGNNSPFNAQNPYVQVQPPYHSLYLDGNLSGPLGKKSSLFAAGTYFDQASNAIVNTTNVSESVRNPQISSTYSARVDRQLSTNNTLIGRYEYNQIRVTNGGVGLLVLPSEGFNNTTTMQTLQLSNTQVVNPHIINETRFQYIRTRLDQAIADTSPTVIVQGAFNGGGSTAGTIRDAQDRYEFQDYLTLEKGKHFIRTGGRYRLLRDANYSTANYNGAFIFPDLATYNLALSGSETGATQYSVTSGQANATVLTGDLGVYAEDEWKTAKNLTLTFGLRFETQSAIPDHADWAPRAGFAWGIHQEGSKPALLVLRGGAGLFYDRFIAGNILTAIRQNGVSQHTYVVQNPQFFTNIPAPAQLQNATAPTTYTISPRLRAAQSIVASVSVDHTFGKIGSVSLGLFHFQGVHQYLSRNINAPLPGTFVTTDPTSGVRPFGGTTNLYQFSSDATSNVLVGFVNGSLTLSKYTSLFGFAALGRQRGSSSGANSFPSNEYDLRADYGRQAGDQQQFYVGLYNKLPWNIGVDSFVFANTSPPFNITVGEDLNGDAQYNDRPSFATDLTRPSVRRTAYGNFDLAPVAGQTIIPVNYGHAAGYLSLQLQVSKGFKLGPRPSAPPPAADSKDDKDKDAKDKAAATAAKGPAPKPDRPYTLTFEVQGDNILNFVNPAPPVGVLESPLFGKVISLNSGFSNSTGANRTITLRTSFTF